MKRPPITPEQAGVLSLNHLEATTDEQFRQYLLARYGQDSYGLCVWEEELKALEDEPIANGWECNIQRENPYETK